MSEKKAVEPSTEEKKRRKHKEERSKSRALDNKSTMKNSGWLDI